MRMTDAEEFAAEYGMRKSSYQSGEEFLSAVEAEWWRRTQAESDARHKVREARKQFLKDRRHGHHFHYMTRQCVGCGKSVRGYQSAQFAEQEVCVANPECNPPEESLASWVYPYEKDAMKAKQEYSEKMKAKRKEFDELVSKDSITVATWSWTDVAVWFVVLPLILLASLWMWIEFIQWAMEVPI